MGKESESRASSERSADNRESNEGKIDPEVLRQRVAERFLDLGIDLSILSDGDLEIFSRLGNEGVPRDEFDSWRAEVTRDSMKRAESLGPDYEDPIIRFISAISRASRMNERGVYKLTEQK